MLPVIIRKNLIHNMLEHLSALRENSEKWPIDGELSILPFLGFSTPGLGPFTRRSDNQSSDAVLRGGLKP